jgi:excinuclease ABC subunit A
MSLKQPLKKIDHFDPGSQDVITVQGAREHNLKNVSVTLPKQKMIIFTGVSGSGKSSLAFDTIFAEGQRRYIESLSSYARQFLGQMEKPEYDAIRGLSPTISIEQKATSKNPRSTVGTITEVYDYLRVLYARMGTQFCHICGSEVGQGSSQSMVDRIMSFPSGTKILLLAPVIKEKKGEHKDLIATLKSKGFARARINGVVTELDNIQTLAKNKKHTIDVVVDRLVVKDNKEFRTRLSDSVDTALANGSGSMIVQNQETGTDIYMSEKRTCCGIGFEELEPTLFSFNSPKGMCEECNGIGTVMSMDVDKLIPDKSMSINGGAILPWRNQLNNKEGREDNWFFSKINALKKEFKIDFNKPWNKLPIKHRNIILYGSKDKTFTIKWKGESSQGSWETSFEGLIPGYMRRYKTTHSEAMKTWYGKFMSNARCTECRGKRLKPPVLAVKIQGKSISDLTDLTVKEVSDFASKLTLTQGQKIIAGELLKEIRARLQFLINVGLEYLSLSRRGPTLSGGEAQRIRLASQIGSELTGVLYVLDEPSIGLHQRDNHKLLETLKKLRDIGNTLIVVEHDEETIEAADWIVDFGPGAGSQGGEVVGSGTLEDIKRCARSLTGQYLSGRRAITTPKMRRSISKDARYLEILGAQENNLKDIDIRIPLGVLCAITGVSGAGKSTLIHQILYPALSQHLYHSEETPGTHREIKGLKHLDKIINIDQRPIGRTPRSNPATYTKLFDHIRDFFAMLPESATRGYQKGRFSFNVKGGRCEKCQGDGAIKVEMHFLSDVYVPCEECKGKRFNRATLDVKYNGHSISDVLDMSVAQAMEAFKNHTKIMAILKTLDDVGLSYIKLGQPATTLSGGEAQRVKLARELAKIDTGRTIYILDEPTTGLHFEDINHLLGVLNRLVDGGNTVLVVEHNLDVIKTADWIIDLGPEGGDLGGRIVTQGTPEQVAKHKTSYTGKFLAKVLG